MNCTNCDSSTPRPDPSGLCPTCSAWSKRHPMSFEDGFLTAPPSKTIGARGSLTLGNGATMSLNWTMDNQSKPTNKQSLIEFLEEI